VIVRPPPFSAGRVCPHKSDSPSCSAFVSGDLYNGMPREIKATFEGAIAYFGHMYA